MCHIFGRKFDRDQFQDMCRTLRVLNAVRQFEIGIPLSIQQFKVCPETLFCRSSGLFSSCISSPLVHVVRVPWIFLLHCFL